MACIQLASLVDHIPNHLFSRIKRGRKIFQECRRQERQRERENGTAIINLAGNLPLGLSCLDSIDGQPLCRWMGKENKADGIEMCTETVTF